MELKEFEDMIKSRNWEALNVVSAAKDPMVFVPILEDALKNSDEEIRELGINGLTIIDNPEIPGKIMPALKDTDREVRTAAIQYLRSNYNESILRGLIDNLKNPDFEIRGGIALILGDLGHQKAVAPLKESLGGDENKGIARDIELALAKLGNTELKEKFASGLKSELVDIRLKAMDDLRYINDKGYALRLGPALDDRTVAYLCGTPDNPKEGRICDAAINLLAKWYKGDLGFQTYEIKIYSDDEIDLAKEFLNSLGGNQNER